MNKSKLVIEVIKKDGTKYNKEFHVHNEKSLGYMVGYLNAIEWHEGSFTYTSSEPLSEALVARLSN